MLANWLQRTVIWHRERAASAPLHYALTPRWTRYRAAAELRRYVAGEGCRNLTRFCCFRYSPFVLRLSEARQHLFLVGCQPVSGGG
jgi:hypothetical protein